MLFFTCRQVAQYMKPAAKQTANQTTWRTRQISRCLETFRRKIIPSEMPSVIRLQMHFAGWSQPLQSYILEIGGAGFNSALRWPRTRRIRP